MSIWEKALKTKQWTPWLRAYMNLAGAHAIVLLRCPPDKKTKKRGKDYAILIREIGKTAKFEVFARSGPTNTIRQKSRLAQCRKFTNELKAMKWAASLIHRKIHKKVKKRYRIKQLWFQDEMTDRCLRHLVETIPCAVPFAEDITSNPNLDLMDRLDALELG